MKTKKPQQDFIPVEAFFGKWLHAHSFPSDGFFASGTQGWAGWSLWHCLMVSGEHFSGSPFSISGFWQQHDFSSLMR
jgi:hypothetical protein